MWCRITREFRFSLYFGLAFRTQWSVLSWRDSSNCPLQRSKTRRRWVLWFLGKCFWCWMNGMNLTYCKLIDSLWMLAIETEKRSSIQPVSLKETFTPISTMKSEVSNRRVLLFRMNSPRRQSFFLSSMEFGVRRSRAATCREIQRSFYLQCRWIAASEQRFREEKRWERD